MSVVVTSLDYFMSLSICFSLDLCSSLVESSKARRVRLEDARNFFQFLQDHEEEESWLVEKQRICKAGISAKDLRAVLSLQQKHKVSLWVAGPQLQLQLQPVYQAHGVVPIHRN